MWPYLNTCLKKPYKEYEKQTFYFNKIWGQSGNKLKKFLKKEKKIPFAGLYSYKVKVKSSLLVFYCCLEIITNLVALNIYYLRVSVSKSPALASWGEIKVLTQLLSPLRFGVCQANSGCWQNLVSC